MVNMRLNVNHPLRRETDYALYALAQMEEPHRIKSYAVYPDKPAVSRKVALVALACVLLSGWAVWYIIKPIVVCAVRVHNA